MNPVFVFPIAIIVLLIGVRIISEGFSAYERGRRRAHPYDSSFTGAILIVLGVTIFAGDIMVTVFSLLR